MGENIQVQIKRAECLFNDASDKHFDSYPFGNQTCYKNAAFLFQRAAEIFLKCGKKQRYIESLCFYYDCLADCNYYIFGNWSVSSYCYEKAKYYAQDLILMNLGPQDSLFWKKEILYFDALIHETLAFTMEKKKSYVEANRNYLKAIKAYRQCLKQETDEKSRRLLKHSIVGLRAGLIFVQGLMEEEKDNRAKAKELFLRSLSLFDQALSYHPSWKNTGHMDDFLIWTDPVRKAIERVSN
jgi:tetratricopeptide (TPR) repeat protein